MIQIVKNDQLFFFFLTNMCSGPALLRPAYSLTNSWETVHSAGHLFFSSVMIIPTPLSWSTEKTSYLTWQGTSEAVQMSLKPIGRMKRSCFLQQTCGGQLFFVGSSKIKGTVDIKLISFERQWSLTAIQFKWLTTISSTPTETKIMGHLHHFKFHLLEKSCIVINNAILLPVTSITVKLPAWQSCSVTTCPLYLLDSWERTLSLSYRFPKAGSALPKPSMLSVLSLTVCSTSCLLQQARKKSGQKDRQRTVRWQETSPVWGLFWLLQVSGSVRQWNSLFFKKKKVLLLGIALGKS